MYVGFGFVWFGFSSGVFLHSSHITTTRGKDADSEDGAKPKKKTVLKPLTNLQRMYRVLASIDAEVAIRRYDNDEKRCGTIHLLTHAADPDPQMQNEVFKRTMGNVAHYTVIPPLQEGSWDAQVRCPPNSDKLEAGPDPEKDPNFSTLTTRGTSTGFAFPLRGPGHPKVMGVNNKQDDNTADRQKMLVAASRWQFEYNMQSDQLNKCRIASQCRYGLGFAETQTLVESTIASVELDEICTGPTCVNWVEKLNKKAGEMGEAAQHGVDTPQYLKFNDEAQLRLQKIVEGVEKEEREELGERAAVIAAAAAAA